jgi:hypothetical protein
MYEPTAPCAFRLGVRVVSLLRLTCWRSLTRVDIREAYIRVANTGQRLFDFGPV